MSCKTVRLAFDADARTNPVVARALLAFALAAVAEGLAIELERWPAEHKGVDDAVAAGAALEVLAGEAALAAAREIAQAAGMKTTEGGAAGLERLPGVLAAGGPAALFRDRALLQALAELRATDAAGWAAKRAELSEAGVRLRDLDAALDPFVREVRARQPAAATAVLGEAGYCVRDGRLCRSRRTSTATVKRPALSHAEEGRSNRIELPDA